MESYTLSETMTLILLCVVILCGFCCCMYRNVLQNGSTKPTRRKRRRVGNTRRVENLNQNLQVETGLTRDSRLSHIPYISPIDNITYLHTSISVTQEIPVVKDLPPAYEEINQENIAYLPINDNLFLPSYVEATTIESSKYFSKYFT